jgi:hypothetical protein
MGPEAIPGIPKRGRIAEAPAVLLLLNVESVPNRQGPWAPYSAKEPGTRAESMLR